MNGVGGTEASRAAAPAPRAAAPPRALAIIRQGASLTEQTAIGAHLAHRARLFTFPNPFPACAWGNDPRAQAEQLEPLPAAELRQRIAASSVKAEGTRRRRPHGEPRQPRRRRHTAASRSRQASSAAALAASGERRR